MAAAAPTTRLFLPFGSSSGAAAVAFHLNFRWNRPRPPSSTLALRGLISFGRKGNGKDNISCSMREKRKKKRSAAAAAAESAAMDKAKRRTRSAREFSDELLSPYLSSPSSSSSEGGDHIPVMLGEVLEVFRTRHLRSFVDCTLGAAGHSSAVSHHNPPPHQSILLSFVDFLNGVIPEMHL